MDKPIEFRNLAFEQKVKFMADCQAILLKYHPHSPFVIRSRHDTFFRTLVDESRGDVYVIPGEFFIMYGRINIKDINNANEELVRGQRDYAVPNAYIVDFVAGEMTLDKIDKICHFFAEENMKYIVYQRSGKWNAVEKSRFEAEIRRFIGTGVF